MKLNITVIKNASPHPMAANLNRVFWIRILVEYSCDVAISSEVISSIIDVVASQRLRSKSVKGMFILISSTCLSQKKNKVN
jgi:hypothetical protein